MAKKSKRISLSDNKSSGGVYFSSDKKHIKFVSSGCAMIDNILGGGYPLGRIVNIIGDKSTAKTALATEAIINFLNKYPNGRAAYRDVENAFDVPYAEAMCMPVDKVDFGSEDEEDKIETAEDFYRDFSYFLEDCIKDSTPGIYVLDSLDALTDEASLGRDISKGSYDLDKQKVMNKFFKDFKSDIGRAEILLIIISQVRENIGFVVGEKYRRAGGKALDFYASQIMWLSHLKILTKQVKKMKYPIGIHIKAHVKKNKIGLPFRSCEFDFIFGYGVDDLLCNIAWLESVGRLSDVDLSAKSLKAYKNDLEEFSDKEYNEEREFVSKAVKKVWREIETTFLPKRRKY